MGGMLVYCGICNGNENEEQRMSKMKSLGAEDAEILKRTILDLAKHELQTPHLLFFTPLR